MSFTLAFKVRAEIRMGSPFNNAEVILTGSYIPQIKMSGFQDKGILSRDCKLCYLIHWEPNIDGGPAFSVWKLDETDRSVFQSKIIQGCCESISELPDSSGVLLTVWQYEHGSREEIIDSFPEALEVST